MLGLLFITIATAIVVVIGIGKNTFDRRGVQRHSSNLNAEFRHLWLEDTPFLLVQFSSQVCGPCQTLRRSLTPYATHRADISYVDVHLEQQPDLFAAFKVTRTPTLIIVHRSGASYRTSGPTSLQQIIAALDSLEQTADSQPSAVKVSEFTHG